MDFEGSMLSEISQMGKDKYHMISLLCVICWFKKKKSPVQRYREQAGGCLKQGVEGGQNGTGDQRYKLSVIK